MRDLFSYLAEHRGVLIVVLVISLVSAGLSLAQPVMVNRVIDGVGAGTAIGGTVIILVALVVAAGITEAVQQYLLGRTAEGVVFSARRRLLGRLLRLPVKEYDTRRTGDLVSRVGSDTTMVREALTGGLIEAVSGALVFVGALIAMALLDLTLLGITAAVVLVAVLCVTLVSSRIQALTLESQEALGRVSSGVERAISGVRTIRASGATAREEAALVADAGAAYRLGVRIVRISALLWPVSGLAIQGAFLAVLGVGGYRVASGTLSVADLVTFILFLFMMLMPLGTAFGAVITVRTALGALSRIEEVLDLPSESDDDAPALRSADRIAQPASVNQVEFDRVSFAYRDGEPVLREASFAVPHGSTTALVGPSGAGKSTALALIERFYDPADGSISVDGTDIRDMPRAELRARIGYVEQDAPVLAGTIRDNLLLAAPEADEARCRRVLAEVNLLDRIDQHPLGLDAVVGDDGAGLSGGERQRLSIARALIADTPLLLLDEPTASLDARNESAMRSAIESASIGRTVVIIAHRLATVADADQIVVLDDGRVTATGTHAELLETSDLYRDLARRQLLVR
nr:ABC transporter ATP-binding protein [Brevibacterium sp. R8603A2]